MVPVSVKHGVAPGQPGSAWSQTKVALTLFAVASPVLQTRAPTRYSFGPSLTLLLSRPMTFQVIGGGGLVPSGGGTEAEPGGIVEIVRFAAAWTEPGASKAMIQAPIASPDRVQIPRRSYGHRFVYSAIPAGGDATLRPPRAGQACRLPCDQAAIGDSNGKYGEALRRNRVNAAVTSTVVLRVDYRHALLEDSRHPLTCSGHAA